LESRYPHQYYKGISMQKIYGPYLRKDGPFCSRQCVGKIHN